MIFLNKKAARKATSQKQVALKNFTFLYDIRRKSPIFVTVTGIILIF